MPHKTEVVKVTPTLAQQYLCHNHNNRAVRWTAVKSLAEEMKAGNWQLTHQGIAFDTNGRLIDGQHRLLAVVESGATVPMTVVSNCDPASFLVLDQGVRRTGADVLNAQPRIAQVCGLASRYITHRVRPTPSQLQTAYNAIGKLAEELSESCGSAAVYFSSASVRLAAIVRVMDLQDKDYVFDLYGKLCRGDAADLPPIGVAFMKQRLRHKSGTLDKGDVLSRALYVFDRQNADINRMRQPDVAAATDYVRSVLRPAFEKATASTEELPYKVAKPAKLRRVS